MANPTPYAPEYAFSDVPSFFPAEPLNNELDNVATAIDETITALADVRRSDGKLKNGVVTPESLSADVLLGIGDPTSWNAGKTFAARATVYRNNSIYITYVAHTAGSDFAADVAAGLWTQIIVFTGLDGMPRVTYDPRLIAADVFDRANHTGTIPVENVAGLTALISAIQTRPETYGAVGDGVADDTTAVQAALNAGTSIWLTGVYKTTAALTLTGSFKQLAGPGRLAPVGNFNALTVSGTVGVSIDVAMNCIGQTGGYALAIIGGAERVRVKRLFVADSGFNGIYVEEANSVTIDWFYAIALRGTFGVRWYGNSTKRSDILTIGLGVCAFVDGTSGVGLDWDGNCNSLSVNSFHAVGTADGTSSLLHGLQIRNSSGGPAPQIGRIFQFAADFTQSHGMNVLFGDDIDFVAPYLNGGPGNTGSGVYVSPVNVQSDAVRVLGGKAIGYGRYGVESSVARVLASNMSVYGNTLGNTLGVIGGYAARFSTGTATYLEGNSTQAVLNWDVADFTRFNFAENRLVDAIAGADVFSRLPDRTQTHVPAELKGYAVAELPTAGRAGQVVYCGNGNGGAGCLAVSDGATWRRIAFGTTVNATT